MMMQALMGGGGSFVQLLGGDASHLVLLPAGAVADWVFGNDGTLVRGQGASNFNEPNWRSPTLAGVGSGFWVRATVTAGSTPNGAAVDAWLQLNTSRQWSVSRSTLGLTSSTISISIASDAAGANVIATATYTLNAECDS